MNDDDESGVVYCAQCGDEIDEGEALWDDGTPLCSDACMEEAKAEDDTDSGDSPT